jgi:tetratricopeptide (TPR) repeat protein
MSEHHHDNRGCPQCWQEEWKTLQGAEGVDRGISLVRLSRYAWRAKQWAYSMRLAEEALEIFAADPMRVGNQAECYAVMAINARELGRNDEAFAFLDRSLDLYSQEGDAIGVAWENSRCWWKFEDKEYEAALAFYRMTLEKNRKNDDTTAAVYDLIMVGCCLYRLGQFDQAIAKYREARLLSKEDYQSYFVAMCDHNIGESLLADGSPIEAQGYVEQALEVFRLHENPLRLGQSLQLLGMVFAAREMHEKAIECFQSALGYMRAEKPPRMEEIIEIETAMAQVYRTTGRVDEAESVAARLVRVAAIMQTESDTIAS